MTSITKIQEASSHAAGPISHVAGQLADEIFQDLKDARAPKKMRIVPVVSVTVELTYVNKDD